MSLKFCLWISILSPLFAEVILSFSHSGYEPKTNDESGDKWADRARDGPHRGRGVAHQQCGNAALTVTMTTSSTQINGSQLFFVIFFHFVSLCPLRDISTLPRGVDRSRRSPTYFSLTVRQKYGKWENLQNSSVWKTRGLNLKSGNSKPFVNIFSGLLLKLVPKSMDTAIAKVVNKVIDKILDKA